MVMGSARDGGVADIRPVAPEGAGRPHMFDAGDQRLIHAIVLLMIVERSAEVQPLLLQAMAARASGLILFDADGCPVFIDDGARAIFAARDGLCLNGTGFVTERGPETRRLQLMIARGLTGSTQITPPVRRMQMLVTRSSLCRPYLVRVLTIAQPRGHAPGGIACAVHIHDLAAIHVPDRLLLREIFGLTRREVDLAIELVRAGGLAPAAAAAGMAHNTARNHLHGIFAKCCVASQAEAVRLLSTLP
ncbi:helix-turn-helix transcriptional regulator [Sphingomonas sp.]|uniref:helix-turn-helix transcriptional regulator n=1 Tax=Sphingomonas sp. TaxID=28214 RepID=UPI003F723B3F